MFQYKIKYLLILTFILFTLTSVGAKNKVEHKIAVLVNEEVITSYDIIQRLKLEAIVKNIDLNNNNNQLMINNIVDALIMEKLKLEKINAYKLNINDDEYIRFEDSFFENNSLDRDKIFSLLSDNNINYQELKNLLTNELLWSKLISRLYYRLTSVSEIEVDEIIKKNPNISIEQAQNLVIQRQLDLQSSKLLRDMMNEATIEYK